jgi:hypothetical protein
MRMRLRLNLVSLGLLVGFAGGSAWALDKPEQVGAAFCEARTAGNEQRIRALLTASLLKAIEEAEARNDTIAKAAPNEKPPLGDGIPYQGFPDHAPICKAGKVKQTSGRTELEIRYEFPEAPDAGWTDKLLLVSTDGSLLIDDIVYQIPANHTEEIGLRSVLFNAFDQ